jgi:arsenate reductase-like glutaredoxin family protein
MANLENLKVKSVSEMSQDELEELLKSIRLSRRSLRRSASRRKPTTSKKKDKQLSAAEASKLLELLEGGNE